MYVDRLVLSLESVPLFRTEEFSTYNVSNTHCTDSVKVSTRTMEFGLGPHDQQPPLQGKILHHRQTNAISADEHVKDVVHHKGNIMYIHCKTIDSIPYSFTICIDNSKSPFSTLYFLIFLIRNSDKAKFSIPLVFSAPDTPVYNKSHKYQELEYRYQTTELRMEFYIHLFKLFCHPGASVYSVFNGTKIVCSGLVSDACTLIVHFAVMNYHITVVHDFRSNQPKFITMVLISSI